MEKHGGTKGERLLPFIRATFAIVSCEAHAEAIGWNLAGTGIEVRNVSKCCEHVLPRFFKHSNYSSFVRQLNLYGFEKVAGVNGVCF